MKSHVKLKNFYFNNFNSYTDTKELNVRHGVVKTKSQTLKCSDLYKKIPMIAYIWQHENEPLNTFLKPILCPFFIYRMHTAFPLSLTLVLADGNLWALSYPAILLTEYILKNLPRAILLWLVSYTHLVNFSAANFPASSRGSAFCDKKKYLKYTLESSSIFVPSTHTAWKLWFAHKDIFFVSCCTLFPKRRTRKLAMFVVLVCLYSW